MRAGREGRRREKLGTLPSPAPLPLSPPLLLPPQSSPTSSDLSGSAAVLLQGQALPAPAPLCPSGPRVPAASCRCIPPGLHGWLLRFPSSEQPVPRIEFSVLNTQRSFCFSWLDLVIHPGSHLKGKGSDSTVWTRAPALLLPRAGPWTSHSSFAQGRTRAQRGPLVSPPSISSGPGLGLPHLRQVECISGLRASALPGSKPFAECF